MNTAMKLLATPSVLLAMLLAFSLPACDQGPVEICDDGADNDSDGGYDCADTDCAGTEGCPDADGDSFATVDSGGLDCNDNNPNIHPAATEICDGVDNDCHGEGDEGAVDAITWYGDYDYDGHGGSDFIEVSCEPVEGHVTTSTDCDDYDDTIYPDAKELCDEIDNDCDGEIDEDGDDRTWYGDSDGDGYGGDQFIYQGCAAPTGYVDNTEDCDDLNPEAYPGAPEGCDGQDYNCDGAADTAGIDADEDGQTGCEGDCNDNAAEINGLDLDGDGIASCEGDCDDSNPAAASLANDSDCDGIPSSLDCDDFNSAIGACGSCLGSYVVDETDSAADLSAIAGCLSIEGSLEITATALTDLNPLSQLSIVGGLLIIWNNPLLTDITGLSNLSAVGDSLFIWDNPLLCDSAVTSFINSCTVTGSIHIDANSGC